MRFDVIEEHKRTFPARRNDVRTAIAVNIGSGNLRSHTGVVIDEVRHEFYLSSRLAD